ncbi:hypothetical protein ABPG77_003872 [Micractinium sp. CCAP 211/92]
MHEERPTPATDVFTPEALRRSGSGQVAPTRPGEASPARSTRSNSSVKTFSKMRHRLRRCGRTMGFVPWLALLALALLVGGITIFAIKGLPAADAATQLLAALGSATDTGFPLYMKAFQSSVWATVGVAGAAAVLLVLAASVRLDQRFRRDGNVYSQSKGPYGKLVFRIFGVLSWLGLLLMVLLSLWMVVNGVLLSSWAAQCWNLEKASCGASTTSSSIASLDALGSQYSQTLDNFATAVMAVAGGSSVLVGSPDAAPAPAPSAESAPTLPPPAFPPPVASPSPTLPPSSPPPTVMSPPPVTPPPAEAAAASAVPPAATSTIKTMAAGPIATPNTVAALNATLSSGLAALKQLSANWTGDNSTLPLMQANGLCPSAACLNAALYPFTESSACVCSAASAASLADLAKEASKSAVWAAVGVAALFCGALFGCMEAAKDGVLLPADQLFLKVVRRRSRQVLGLVTGEKIMRARRSTSSGRGSLKGEDSGYKALTAAQAVRSLREANLSPGAAVPAPGPSYSLMARG